MCACTSRRGPDPPTRAITLPTGSRRTCAHRSLQRCSSRSASSCSAPDGAETAHNSVNTRVRSIAPPYVDRVDISGGKTTDTGGVSRRVSRGSKGMAPSIAVPGEPHLIARLDVHRLFQRYHSEHDPADREALLERFLPLARHLARRYVTGGADADDLEQVASLALLKAIDRFDPSRGLAFTSFAVPTIIGELKRHFRDYGWSVRVPRALKELAAKVDDAVETLNGELGRTPTTEEIAARCEVGVEQVLEARATATAHRADSLDKPAFEDDEETVGPAIGAEDPAFERVERAADIDRLLALLPEREQRILRLRFEQDLVQREIADRVGLSQMQVSRSITQSINALRDADPPGA